MIGGYHQLGTPEFVVAGDNQGYPWPAQGCHPPQGRQQTLQALGETRQSHLIYFQTTTSRSFLLTNINYSDYWITLGLGTWTVSISSEYFSLDVLNHLCEVVV